ncbi:MAG TPA: ThuA domain-containing protein [Bacteroidales bacterium]|nr:ThuA domain-containing protein [Bacteroidales bacterium]HBZ20245.1 ThuA domain-containing protein [Bacteroidales bacterium]
MKARILFIFLFTLLIPLTSLKAVPGSIRILVITGGHGYKVEEFNQMLASLGPRITYQVAELPVAFEMFKPENRDKYDVLVFYHMWQTISDEQETDFADCIRQGKPVVALHHSICAFDDWPEYWNIIGGKYFHKTTTFKDKEYAPCSYIHDLHFNVRITDRKHPVTKGLSDFPVFDETYKGYYVEDGVTPLLTTEEPSSTPTIGWAKQYGKSRVVVLQSGHDVPTFENENFRKLLRQAIEWVSKK